ncbi:MAG TPA: lamin tail domain-containing protein, partial [Pyrinomonadaceae bacterium]|nr:lamin tail domain-containing protein [Pyrinomonadaceae bacterium]
MSARLLIILFFLWHCYAVRAQSVELSRLTDSPPTAINLHPLLSGDANRFVFESSFDFARSGGQDAFRALRADLTDSHAAFKQLAVSRLTEPTMSFDGSVIAFSSNDDPLGENPDRNAEIFLFDGGALHQITHTVKMSTQGDDIVGCGQPSLDRRGTTLVYACHGEAAGGGDFQIFLHDIAARSATKIFLDHCPLTAISAAISGDGSTIVYVERISDADDPSLKRLVLYNRLSNTRRIAVQSATLALSVAVSLTDDGTRILYLDADDKGVQQIYLYDAATDLIRRLTSFPPRKDDVPLNPCLSTDGRRIAFATRRRIDKTNPDGGVDVYLLDIPTNELINVTSAPAGALSAPDLSLSHDGATLLFSFSRILSVANSFSEDDANCEIFRARVGLSPRHSDALQILHGAVPTPDQSAPPQLAPEQIVLARGQRLAFATQYAQPSPGGDFPVQLSGTTIFVNGKAAQIIYTSPAEVSFLLPPETIDGEAQITVRNIDGFKSRGMAHVARTAPGLFALTGDGKGDGIFFSPENALDLTSEHHPLQFSSPLVAFGTGLRHASALTLIVNGETAATAPRLVPSPDLPGLDQIVFDVPRKWRGAHRVDYVIQADGKNSTPVNLFVGAADKNDVMINEVLADPAAGAAGDANHDGVRDGGDEFIELVNPAPEDLIITNWTISTRPLNGTKETVIHKFGSSSVPAGDALVIFGEGNFVADDPLFGGAQVMKASSGGLDLSNTGGRILIRDAGGALINEFIYGTEHDDFGGNGVNQSITRSPDMTGEFIRHSRVGEGKKLFSPGTRTDGTFFAPRRGRLSRIEVSASRAELLTGDTALVTAIAFDQYNRPLPNVSFGVEASGGIVSTGIEATDANSSAARILVRAQSEGSAEVIISATVGEVTVRSASLRFQIIHPPPRISSIEISPQQFTLNRGEKRTLSVRVFDENQQQIANAKLAFTSADPLIVNVDQNGSISAVAPGGTTVTVKATDDYGHEISAQTSVRVLLPLVINEVLADVPPDDPKTTAIEGDANHDGVRSTGDDEFVELVNYSAAPIDISGVT